MSLLSQLEPLTIDVPLVLLVSLVIASSMAVIYSKHIGRSEFVALQKLEYKRDQMNEEWGRLLLEQSTWANPGRVDQQARLRLQMTVPSSDATVLIQP
ncbi:MAG: cell division protein FtsL [Methylophaga sp.]|nr:cell division protein FtsL [Methylophaga sp.]